MQTKVLKGKNDIEKAAEIIRSGGLVAFPTETVYGLGANAYDPQAAQKIYEAKGRPSDNPLIVHVADMDGVSEVAEDIPETAGILAEKFWPGPMTLVFRKKAAVPDRTTGGLDTVAVRMPSNEIARELIIKSGVPIAAPSANTSGRPSPTTAAHVIDDMDGKIDMIIDGGPCDIGLESTIVDVTGKVPTLLRPGGITYEMLCEAVGEVEIDPAIMGPVGEDIRPKAPGMKYKHYAPKADMTIVVGDAVKVQYKINHMATVDFVNHKNVGIIATRQSAGAYLIGEVRSIGTRDDEETIAHNLFAVLREFDDMGVDVIYSEGFQDTGIGRAIMNRMRKAAGYRIIEV